MKMVVSQSLVAPLIQSVSWDLTHPTTLKGQSAVSGTSLRDATLSLYLSLTITTQYTDTVKVMTIMTKYIYIPPTPSLSTVWRYTTLFYTHCQFLLVQYYCRLLMNIQISREITVNNQNQSLIVLQMFDIVLFLVCPTDQRNGSIYIPG